MNPQLAALRRRVPAPPLALPAFAACSTILASPAFAQAPAPDAAQLDYTRGPGAAACPEDYFFRAFVAARLGGQDPFTPGAPRRITLTLGRKAGAFVAKLDMYDQAGAHLGENDPLVDRDCVKLVEDAGRVVASWLVPLIGPVHDGAFHDGAASGPKPRAPAEPFHDGAASGPKPRAPMEPFPDGGASGPKPFPDGAESEPARGPKPRAPAEPFHDGAVSGVSRPGVFEGGAGFMRALLFGLTAGGLAAGTLFVLAAGDRLDGARQLGGPLQRKVGSSLCTWSMEARRGACEQITDLVQQHDRYTDLAIGTFVAAGVVGGVATASIWLVRMPAAPALQVIPSAPRSLAGLTLQGTW